MDMDYAHYMLTEGEKDEKENTAVESPSREAYKKQLAEALNMNRTRILAFKNKPPTPVELLPRDSTLNQTAKSMKPHRYIPQTSERTLDAPDLVDDFYLNLLDWGSSNVLSIALSNTVYLWDASDDSTSELVTIEEEIGPVTRVNWAPDGWHIAIGLNNSELQLWDSTANRLPRTLRGGHRSRVGSLAWNNHIHTTGGIDGQIINNDVRVRAHIVETYRGHTQEVCGSKWSASGQQLPSGGDYALLWNKNERELLSSHGFTQNQLTFWKYPSMVKMAELTGQTSRVLFMAQSPDGCTIASAAVSFTCHCPLPFCIVVTPFLARLLLVHLWKYFMFLSPASSRLLRDCCCQNNSSWD